MISGRSAGIRAAAAASGFRRSFSVVGTTVASWSARTPAISSASGSHRRTWMS
jgi:hypothetical protein